MNKEETQNSYLKLLEIDLEEHNLDYWGGTQDEMVKALRNLQQERDKYKSIVDELNKWLEEESKKVDTYEVGHLTSICMTLNKIKELEEGEENE